MWAIVIFYIVDLRIIIVNIVIILFDECHHLILPTIFNFSLLMQVALFIILLVTLTNSAPALNYSLFTTFQNPKDLTSITIAPDYSRAILYEVG